MWREDGQALIIAVLCMVAVLGFVALTIDIGQAMQQHQQMQTAADGASLAGTAELPANPTNAVQMARQYALDNGMQSQDIASITVSTTYTANDTLAVQLKSKYNWGFARALGLYQADLGARAVSRLGSPGATAGLTPWAVLQGAINWSGGPTVLKYDSSDVFNGNFGALAIDGNGANVYKNTIENGSTHSLCAQGQPGCSSPTALTEPGNIIGPTRDGVNHLLSETSAACDTFGEAFQLRPDGTYDVRSQCNPWQGASNSKRVLMVPVISSFCNGKCDVTILYFAVFFLNTLDNCTGHNCQVTGQFAKVVTNPAVSTVGSLDNSAAIRSVHLVQ
jgi:hypothetical protein